MKKYSIILPVHKIDGDYEEMLKHSLSSVEDFYNDVKIILVTTPEISEKLSILTEKLEINIVKNEGNTDYQTQIRLGIENCDTEWFSIMEIDDTYNNIWLKSMNEYVESYSDVDIFLTVTKDINIDGTFTHFTNESLWAFNFSDVIGVLDEETLLEYQNFQTSGGLYRTQKIIDNGGMFKDNIKLTYSYEFLLRMLHNGLKVMTVPRIGYEHLNFREDSLFWLYQNDDDYKLDEHETKFWIDTAKKEYFFKNKREIEYKKE